MGNVLDRREFLKVGAQTAIAVGMASYIGNVEAAETKTVRNTSGKSMPNILHIITHDQGRDLGCYGHPDVKTPNLDRLASEGVRFTNHFCASTPCSPSRGCIMTGRYAHSNGLIGLGNFGWDLPINESTVVDYLNDAGYQTYLIGFQHERHDRISNRYKHTLSAAMMCDVVSKNAIDALKNHNPKDGPFYINAGFFEVHSPWDRSEYQGRYKPEELTVPAFMPDLPDVRYELSRYYGSISFMDESVGMILDALRQNGLEENTLVIFTTDHGVSFPRAKSTLYDPGLATALLMRWPGHIKAGIDCDCLANNIDLLPSILELLGIRVPDTIQGRSFAPALLGKNFKENEQIFCERNFHEAFDPMRAVRTRRYKLIRNYGRRGRYPLPSEIKADDPYEKRFICDEPRPFEELYDLQKDPNEFTNVADDPAYGPVLSDLRQRLNKWMLDTDDFIRGAREFVFFSDKTIV